jgi:hypothetical protein
MDVTGGYCLNEVSQAQKVKGHIFTLYVEARPIR